MTNAITSAVINLFFDTSWFSCGASMRNLFLMMPNSLRLLWILFPFAMAFGLANFYLLDENGNNAEDPLVMILGRGFFWLALFEFFLLSFYNVRSFLGGYDDIKPKKCRDQLW